MYVDSIRRSLPSRQASAALVKQCCLSGRTSPELLAFQRDLAGELEQFGVPVETRPYHPHITLATRLTPQRFQAYVEELADYDPSYEFSFTRAGIFQLIDAGRGKRWQLLS